MTVLIGDIKDIGLRPTEGTVTVFSARTRRANGAGGVITRERRDYPLSGGRFRTAELDPGRTTVELVAPGVFESWTFDLPTDGTVSLVDAVELAVDYAPDSAVVNGAAAAAAKAELAAQRASGFESGAERARDEAVQAQASVSRVVESATAIVRGEFTDLTERAESAAVRAEEARDAAASSAEGAAGSVSVAEASAGEAAGSASAAEASAGRAEGSAKTAEGHATSAQSASESAEGSARAARSSADAAASSLGDVNTAVSTATAARTGAESARDEAVHAAESAKTGAPVGGWEIESLSQGVRESLGRADSAITVVPTATASSAGSVKLAGDLAGTWDAPKVPGLADKADAAALSGLVKRLEVLETLRDVLVLDGEAYPWKRIQDELARRGLNHRTVKKIPFSIDARNAKNNELRLLFSGFKELREVPLLVNTSRITDMSGMFEKCESLTSVPDLDTSQVTNMDTMFWGCSSLTDGNVRLIRNDGTKPSSHYNMIGDSGLTREPFFTPDGQPIN
ncbi:BspA family leucine-rich repeat surface protein [Corynebacterium amycolatum]|uniref:BspA family leucine-rich repeat surface protein n=1 Tax=Corynebacterium amycolatum TaxID=43765 RepID=A0AB37GFW7_CORAY|nr:BspA family leucine-rich repeat surface protein [Corynebacterium amycolatum]QPR31914.1 BspA family leucine-rich repeat surface protein [Corynebacterium amycolatum]